VKPSAEDGVTIAVGKPATKPPPWVTQSETGEKLADTGRFW
jgi:hypothetical protein